ncbi:uncharacterized protein PADG_11361 [Paracoccidioides brasiliensis Pb18]|uniref:Uncharacterized protein n=1 Tax=Paracoccidioides brasiliensis (strain Pb18) TaxID=502780 RepID=A0A0A0HVW0_PARBD|nr:uncharacterized protein PADG_11361 [Paracoccidioides brasiliensis Pb18]KGM92533.1 hypothetical protein PADG_11361 [Paracoccidioides brasiliensis Pb18]
MATYMSQDDISLLESVCRTLFVNFFVKEASMKNSVYVVFDVVDEVYGYEMQSMINLMKDINEAISSHVLRAVSLELRTEIVSTLSERTKERFCGLILCSKSLAKTLSRESALKTYAKVVDNHFFSHQN